MRRPQLPVVLRSFLGSLLPLFVVSHFTHHVVTAATAPLLPMIRGSFGLSYTQSGFVLSAFSLTYGLAHLPAGWLNDRIGPTVLILLGIAGVAAAGILAGLAPSFPLLVGALLLMGLCGAGYHPSATSLISRVTPPDRRGGALGIHVAGGSLSHFFAPLIVGGVALLWGWRGSYVALSVPTLGVGAALFYLLRRASRRNAALAAPAAAASEPPRSARFWVHLLSFLLLTTANGALVGSMTGFIPLLSVDRYGFREEAAAGLMAIVFSGGLWVAPLAGRISDRIGRLPILVGGSLLTAPTIFLLARLASAGFAFYLLLVLAGLFMFVRMPVSESFLVGEAPARVRSLLLGIYFLGSNVGGGVMTPLMGSWIDRWGFARGFSLSALLLLLVALVCGVLLFASRPGRSATSP